MSTSLPFDELLTVAGPSGCEGGPSELWRAAARAFCDDIRGDVLGSTTALIRGRGNGPRLAIMAHIDEIGLLITCIDDAGMLWFTTVGLWDQLNLIGQRVEILTGNGPVPGVIGRKPVHLVADDEAQRMPAVRELHIDIGARDGAQARGLVEVGDAAVVAARPVTLPNGRIVSRALDNRVGCYVALEAARRIAAAGPPSGDVLAVACSQEETTYAGAATSAFARRPDIAIVIDTTYATDAPGLDVRLLGDHPLGSGPAIGRGPILHPRVFDLLRETAQAEGIDHTVHAQLSGDRTWTDSDAIYLTGAGVAVGLVSIPTRYLHSPVEMIQLSDVDAAIRLIAAFAARLNGPVELDQ